MRRTLPMLAALLAALVLLLRLAPPGGDMAGFLPRSDRAEAQFLLGELQRGAATTLLLAGIESAPVHELARISRAMGAALAASGRFAFIGNGAADISEAEREQIFAHRYLLSPTVTREAFSTPALREKLESLLDGLRSAAAPLVRQFGFADPPGAFFAYARGLLGESRVVLHEGAWFADSEGPPRALLLARGRANGLDPQGQQAAADAVREAFAAAAPGGARLLLSGPGIFAAEAARAIRADVEMVSLLSGLLVAAFLLWRTRAPALLPLVAVPLVAGMVAGYAAVLLVFGTVHGAAFGFGMTMLGVAVDYPLLILAQRRADESLAATARRLGPTLRLATLAAILGMAAMLGAGFSGLRQLGLFAATGLAVSALAARFLLPWLGADAAPTSRPLPRLMLRALLALPRLRPLMLVLPGAAALVMAASGGAPMEGDIAALSPVPAESRRLDAELRAALGAPDVGTFIVLRAADMEGALAASEAAAAALAPLIASGRLAGLDHPARYLPSAATQRARQALLPDDADLACAMAEAQAGLPFRATAFAPFLEGVAASRSRAPLTTADLPAGSTLATRLAPLLAQTPVGAHALMLPLGPASPRASARPAEGATAPVVDDQALASALRAALSGIPGALIVELRPELSRLLAAASGQAALAAGLGAALVLGVLLLGLRSIGKAVTVTLPIAGALVLTVATLALLGERLNLFHLAALLLLAGIGLDYALFLCAEAGPAVLGAVWTCMMMTLLTFGLLAFCATPVLRSIGLTVAIGTAYAFLLAAALVPSADAAT